MEWSDDCFDVGEFYGKVGIEGGYMGKIGVSVEIEHVNEIAEILGLFSLKYAHLKRPQTIICRRKNPVKSMSFGF